MADKAKVDTKNVFIDKNAVGSPSHQTGSPLGYYSLSLYSTMNGNPRCDSAPFYTEGFAAGKCLPTASGGIRYDCSGPKLPPPSPSTSPTTSPPPPSYGVSSAGVYVTTFTTTTCTDAGTTTYVIPMGKCTPFNQNMVNGPSSSSVTTAMQSYGNYAMASCTSLSPDMPGIPVKPAPGYSAIIESTYSSSGVCTTNSSTNAYAQGLKGSTAQLPDTFKAFIQTPISTKSYTQPGCIVGVANTNLNFKLSFTSGFTIPSAPPGAPVVPRAGDTIGTMMTAHFTPNFDWACFAPASYPSVTKDGKPGPPNSVLYNSLSSANPLSSNQCYGLSSTSYGSLQASTTHPLLTLAASATATTLPIMTSVADCSKACYSILPRCRKPPIQPSTQPSSQPSEQPFSKVFKNILFLF